MEFWTIKLELVTVRVCAGSWIRPPKPKMEPVFFTFPIRRQRTCCERKFQSVSVRSQRLLVPIFRSWLSLCTFVFWFCRCFGLIVNNTWVENICSASSSDGLTFNPSRLRTYTHAHRWAHNPVAVYNHPTALAFHTQSPRYDPFSSQGQCCSLPNGILGSYVNCRSLFGAIVFQNTLTSSTWSFILTQILVFFPKPDRVLELGRSATISRL